MTVKKALATALLMASVALPLGASQASAVEVVAPVNVVAAQKATPSATPTPTPTAAPVEEEKSAGDKVKEAASQGFGVLVLILVGFYIVASMAGRSSSQNAARRNLNGEINTFRAAKGAARLIQEQRKNKQG